MFLNWLEQKLEPEQFERLEKLRSTLSEIVYVNIVFAFFAILFWVVPLVFLIWIFNVIFSETALITAHASHIRSMAVSRGSEVLLRSYRRNPYKEIAIAIVFFRWGLHVHPIQYHCLRAFGLFR